MVGQNYYLITFEFKKESNYYTEKLVLAYTFDEACEKIKAKYEFARNFVNNTII